MTVDLSQPEAGCAPVRHESRSGAEALGRGDITAHGMRSAFRDWCGEASSYPRELAEQALANVAGDKTELAYRRGTAIEKRRGLMNDWSAYLLRPPEATGTVVAIRSGARGR